MKLTKIVLRKHTELKIRETVPFIRSDEDLHYVADWFLTFGLSSVRSVLLKNPKMSLADLMLLTTQDSN